MIVQFESEKARLAFVKVPEDSVKIKIADYVYGPPGKGLFFDFPRGGGNTELPPGDWQILCTDAHRAAEEEWEKVVDWSEMAEVGIDDHEGGYKCYTRGYWFHNSAKESGLSLLDHLKIYRQNPYPPFWEKKDDWQEAQERTGRWVVLYQPKNRL